MIAFRGLGGIKRAASVFRMLAALLILMLSSTGISSAGEPYLVRDINNLGLSSSPLNFVEVNGTMYFTATDGTNGSELWKSDGTGVGTVMVKDIYPGTSSSSPANLTNVNGTLYFVATTSANGAELWKSDGTEAGTVMVKDIYPGSMTSGISSLTNVNGTLYFNAANLTNGYELWKSDGTSSGTVMVKDIEPGSASSDPQNLTNLNGTLYFRADDGTHGMELWKSDGTSSGTVMVKDIYSGTGSSQPNYLTSFNGILFFEANDGTNGFELWKSDGTSSGTVMVKDVCQGTVSSYPNYLTNVNGTLYFAATDGTNGTELWKSDGTSSGTVMVKNIYPGSVGSNPAYLTNVAGTLYFQANDGVNGVELWKSDGTSEGTIMVKDIYPGSVGSNTVSLVNFNGTLYFQANDGANGSELWNSDGTTSGTVMVKDIYTGTASASPANLTNVNGILYFTPTNAANGNELWKSDGTSSGTVMVKDINPGSTGSSSAYLTNFNGTLYFQATDGTNGNELWKSDGTSSGTVMVKNIYPGSVGSNPAYLNNFNGMLYFSANNQTNGQELWKSDGTSSGTVMVKDINPGAYSSPSNLTNINGTMYFSANDGTNGEELWKSDGTSSGTVMVKDIYPGSAGSYPANLTNVNGTLYFRASDGANGYELWTSDGTSSGTVMVKDIYPGTGSSYPIYLTNVNGTLYFKASDGTNGNELWKSDGTSSGTVMVKDIYPGSTGSSPAYLANLNGTLYFQANDGANGIELWKSDGTDAGTVMLKDIYPGSAGSSPSYLTNVNSTLYFSANDGTNGQELWKSDGTAGGTVMAKDIYIGSNSSSPSNLTIINCTLFFTATDINGAELWALNINNPSTTSVVTSPNPSSYGSSVTFTATVTPSAATGTVTFKDEATILGTGTLSGGTATFSTSVLAVGTHSITAVYGGDASYAASTSPTLTQTVTIPPASTITAPSNGAYLSRTSYTITGSATDGSGTGLKKMEVGITPSGGTTTWYTATGTASWSYAWTLPADGSYAIQSRATDNAGNVETPAAGVVVLVDKTPPIIMITKPSNFSSVSGAFFTIRGAARDVNAGYGVSSGVNRVEVSVDHRIPWDTASGTEDWSYKWAVPAVNGTCRIEAMAIDNAGNIRIPGASITVYVVHDLASIALEKASCSGQMDEDYVTVTDIDADATEGPGNDKVTVKVVSSSDTVGEVVTLDEDPAVAGRFTGKIGFEPYRSFAGNGKVYVSRGDTVTVTYTDKITPSGIPQDVSAETTWTSGRTMWVRDADGIINDEGTSRADLFGFCASPFGIVSDRVDTIYLDALSAISNNAAYLRSFIADAHAHGIRVECLAGTPEWATPDGLAEANAALDSLAAFNDSGYANERFDGVHINVEPYLLPKWANSMSSVWSGYIVMLDSFRTKVDSYNLAGNGITLAADIPSWFDSAYPGVTSSDAVQDIVDYSVVRVMSDKKNVITPSAQHEVEYAANSGKKVLVGVETGCNAYTPIETFCQEGYLVMDIQLKSAVEGWKAIKSYMGEAIDDYNGYRSFKQLPDQAASKITGR